MPILATVVNPDRGDRPGSSCRCQYTDPSRSGARRVAAAGFISLMVAAIEPLLVDLFVPDLHPRLVLLGRRCVGPADELGQSLHLPGQELAGRASPGAVGRSPPDRRPRPTSAAARRRQGTRADSVMSSSTPGMRSVEIVMLSQVTGKQAGEIIALLLCCPADPYATIALMCLQPSGSMPSRRKMKSGQSQVSPCAVRADVILRSIGLGQPYAFIAADSAARFGMTR